MLLRKFQAQARELCWEMRAGIYRPKFTLLVAAPGTGKSTVPVIAANELLPSIADRLCWIAPRAALQEQAEEGFQKAWLRELLGHRNEIRRSTNDTDPSRDKCGFTTTYQAVVADPSAYTQEFERYRYDLVLDEIHHLDENGAWHRAVAPLVERAAHVWLMTGTLSRHDAKPIAYVPCAPATRERKGRTVRGWEYDLTPTADMAVIRYSRRDALEERAIRLLEFTHADGPVMWIEPSGQTVFAELGSAGADTRKALYTALETDFAHHLLEESVASWTLHRRQWPGAKLLVVVRNVYWAKIVAKWLRALGVTRAQHAAYDDSLAATEAIRRFKRAPEDASALDALVTVYLAYEGLDVPEITDIACLAYIRSREWIEQMMSRANRMHAPFGGWHDQWGTVNTPNDALMLQLLQEARQDQAPFLAERMLAETPSSSTTPPEQLPPPDPIAPTYGAVGSTYVAALDGSAPLTVQETTFVREWLQRYGLSGSIAQAAAALREVQGLPAARPSSPVTQPDIVPSVREATLRKAIERHCRTFDAQNNREPGWMNRECMARFGKSRTIMSEPELVATWQWLQEAYPIQQAV